ncbi:MAG: SipW-dependent-type signal peptide-containing protein [Oscillospiraceae bacterium]
MKARNRIKPLLTLCCALLLVAAGVFGTLAYLTGTDTVNNTFTVGNVKITLDEAKVTTDGTPVEGADRVKANEYHLLPGHTYTKDPTVTVGRQRPELRPHEGHLQQRQGYHRPVY